MDEAALAEKLGRPDLREQALAALHPDRVGDPWQAQLLRYSRGEVDEDGLMSIADDACRLSEGHYAIARQAWLEGDTRRAGEHYQQVLDAEVPRFFEHLRALAWFQRAGG